MASALSVAVAPLGITADDTAWPAGTWRTEHWGRNCHYLLLTLLIAYFCFFMCSHLYGIGCRVFCVNNAVKRADIHAKNIDQITVVKLPQR